MDAHRDGLLNAEEAMIRKVEEGVREDREGVVRRSGRTDRRDMVGKLRWRERLLWYIPCVVQSRAIVNVSNTSMISPSSSASFMNLYPIILFLERKYHIKKMSGSRLESSQSKQPRPVPSTTRSISYCLLLLALLSKYALPFTPAETSIVYQLSVSNSEHIRAAMAQGSPLTRTTTTSPLLPYANIRVHGRHLIDDQGRVIGLRGANVSGCSKV